jgi:hypothetical protein
MIEFLRELEQASASHFIAGELAETIKRSEEKVLHAEV